MKDNSRYPVSGAKSTIEKLPELALSFQQCRILIALEQPRTGKEVAEILSRDPSVVSRQLKSMSEAAPVIERAGGNWRLTPLGREISQWAKRVAHQQHEILAQLQTLRIACYPELAWAIIAPQIGDLANEAKADRVLVQVSSTAGACEQALLLGEADLAFIPYVPEDPRVISLVIGEQPLVAVASPSLVQKLSKHSPEELRKQPYLEYQGGPSFKSLGVNSQVAFSDRLSIR